jgi:hypothetical protein
MRLVSSLRRGFIMSLAVMLLISTGVIRAQDDGDTADEACNMDLSGTIATLVQAQSAASAGNVTEAQALIAEAQTELDAIAACEGGRGEEAMSFDLTQQYEVSADRLFSFSYPGDWLAAEDDHRQNEVSIATSQELLASEFFYDDTPEAIDAGEYVGFIALETPREFGLADMVGLAPSALEFGEEINEQLAITPTVNEVGAVEEIELSSGPAILLTVYGEGYTFVVVLQQVDEIESEALTGEPESLFLFIALAGSPDEVATLTQTAVDIADSAVYTPSDTD